MQDHTTNDPSVKLCECGCGQATLPANCTNTARGWIKGEPKRFVHGHNRRRPLADRLWEKVDKSQQNGCWEWTGYRFTSGHGQIHVNGRTYLVHRLSWELHFGPIPEDLNVCHHCDNPACIRPDHLFVGSQSDNVNDMLSKERQARGSSHSHAKLTETDVARIRFRYSQGNTTYKELAAEYGVAFQTIASIIQRANWRHIA